MTPERWRRITAVFHAALAREPDNRGAFLDEACADDVALRAEVDGMLAGHREAGGFGDDAPTQTPELARLGPGATLGPYRIDALIGAGGMGEVYRARDVRLDRDVAVKVLHVGLTGDLATDDLDPSQRDTPVDNAATRSDLVRRFNDESQILARLDHPYIAHLLDAGLDAAGLPYLVMEHVDGVVLTRYCRERKLGVRDRLALFLKVCAAVQHAHQNLVIHRDIKPGNILVTTAGEPKLLDFGVARVITHSGDLTLTMNRALTLDFASPEQVRGEVVTTATDVYSLGVVLYDLLADRQPYKVEALSLAEAVRSVCDAVPPPPSQVAPAERRAEVAGDLDSIVRKAIEKTPADRYASVSELAADVAAYLDSLPVKARRPSFGYLGRKFVRRHRVGASLAAAFVTLLAAGLAALLWQARVADRERARAQQRFDQVRQLAKYVIFDLQDEVGKLTGSTELRRRMVERSLAYLDSLSGEAAGDTALQVELAGAYQRLGDVLGRPSAANLGDRSGARASYGKARELLNQVISKSPGHPEARRSLGRLLLNLSTTYPEEESQLADQARQQSMTIWEGLVREDGDREENLRGLASAHFAAYSGDGSDRAATVSHMERALELFERLLAAKPDDLDRKRNVALCHKYLGTYFGSRDPRRWHQHALRAAELDSERLRAEPENHQAKVDYTFDISMLGEYHTSQAQYDQALPYYEEALAMRRDLWERDRANVHGRSVLALTLTSLAGVHVMAGHHLRASPLLTEAVELLRGLPKPEAQDWATFTRAYLFLGEVAVASSKDPCPWYRRMQESLLKLPTSMHGQVLPEVARRRTQALDRLKSCPT